MSRSDGNILILSDLHLGSKVLNIRKLLWVLDNIEFNKLIINGDLFDDLNFHRLNKEHWRVLSKIRKISKNKEVIFIQGNHDSNIEVLIYLIGAKYYNEYIFYLNNKKFILTHGHIFDSFTKDLPFLTWIFTGLYYFIQKFSGKRQYIPIFLKEISKRLLRVHIKMRNKAVNFANKRGAQVIICGHSHLADKSKENNIEYINSGTFCDDICNFILIDSLGNCKLEQI